MDTLIPDPSIFGVTSGELTTIITAVAAMALVLALFSLTKN